MSEESEAPKDEKNQTSSEYEASGGVFYFKKEYIQEFRDWIGYKLLTKPDEDTDINDLEEKINRNYNSKQKDEIREIIDEADEDSEISDLKEKIDWTYDPENRDDLREIIRKNPRPTNDDLNTSGVLLRDEILYYQREYNLIEPFEPNSLKPAAYELRVGEQYSVEGEMKNLNKSEKIEIEPFEVAVIQTKERVNLPHFMIGRWNVKVSKAYKGLLWVGGPQVDPGFSGYLSCPIYNLSDTTVSLDFGEELAVIDFIKTTPFNQGGNSEVAKQWDSDEEWNFSEDFDDEPPEPEKYKDDMKSQDRITFSQYNPDDLQSARLFSNIEDKIKELEGKVDQLQTALRVSYAAFVTIIAVLFSALSLITTSQSGGSNSGGAIATVFGLDSSLNLAFTALPWILVIALVYVILYRLMN